MSALRVALVAGEHSGDQLGFKLMRALREATTTRTPPKKSTWRDKVFTFHSMSPV